MRNRIAQAYPPPALVYHAFGKRLPERWAQNDVGCYMQHGSHTHRLIVSR